MISVVTALFEGKNFGSPHSTEIYDASWADKLYRGIKRNSTLPFELVCLVDKEYSFQEPIRQIKFNLNYKSHSGWALLTELYRPDITRDWRVIVGLDTIITGNIDNHLLNPDKDFAMVSDPIFEGEVCNAITWCSPNSAQIIWDVWLNQQEWIRENCRLPPWNTVSEMVLLRKLFNNKNTVPRVDYIYKGIYSYKCHILKYPKLLESASIVYFHGNPKPNQLGTHPVDDKIIENWI